MYRKLSTLLCACAVSLGAAFASNSSSSSGNSCSVPIYASLATPDQTVVYKSSDKRDLKLHIFYPEDGARGSKSKSRPVVISFFGGGWAGGDAKQFFDQSRYYASLGMVGISVDYRVISRDKSTPFESVMDAKSAVRWVRANHKELGIDPDRVVTSGGSAGGHLAICTAVISDVNDGGDELSISAVPNATILFNPVLDTSRETGFGYKRFGDRELELSPVHHVTSSAPATLIFHGSQDSTVPYRNAVDYTAAATSLGVDCRLITAFGENHGFFNSPNFKASAGDRNYMRCMRESALFLADLGYISQKLVPSAVAPLRVACVGDSITYGSSIEDREDNCYPAVLQRLLGSDYEVRNFGLPGATLIHRGNKPYRDGSEYRELLDYGADIIIIKLGTNDSKAHTWRYSSDYEANYADLIRALRTHSPRRPELYLCTPLPSLTSGDTDGINSRLLAEEVAPKVRAVAASEKAVLVDLHKAFAGNSTIFPDRVHPNAEGAALMAEHIYCSISGRAPFAWRVRDGQLYSERRFKVRGFSADAMFEKLRRYFSSAYGRDCDGVLVVEDRTNGLLVGEGRMVLDCSASVCGCRGRRYVVPHSLRAEVSSDGTVLLSITANEALWSSKGGYSSRGTKGVTAPRKGSVDLVDSPMAAAAAADLVELLDSVRSELLL